MDWVYLYMILNSVAPTAKQNFWTLPMLVWYWLTKNFPVGICSLQNTFIDRESCWSGYSLLKAEERKLTHNDFNCILNRINYIPIVIKVHGYGFSNSTQNIFKILVVKWKQGEIYCHFLDVPKYCKHANFTYIRQCKYHPFSYWTFYNISFMTLLISISVFSCFFCI